MVEFELHASLLVLACSRVNGRGGRRRGAVARGHVDGDDGESFRSFWVTFPCEATYSTWDYCTKYDSCRLIGGLWTLDFVNCAFFGG